MKNIILGVVFSISVLLSSQVTMPKAKESYVMDFDKTTTCVVRHIKVYKEPQWAAKIILSNAKQLYFCSPKSMIEFYLHPGKWSYIGVKSEHEFKDIVVTDHKSLKPVNARKAFYVYGSSVISPAGDDLVAFGSEADAKEFSKEFNGKRILKFDEIKLSLIELLNGRI